MPRTLSIALAAAFVLAGCQDDPSFRLRWRIQTEPDVEAPQLRSSVQCSEVGISLVRIETFDALDILTDRRERACFGQSFRNPDATAVGPSLPAGPYTVEVRGLRRNRVGWFAPDDSAAVFDSQSIEVLAEQTIVLDEFVLDAPPQCDDGIDNDRDGLTDRFDPPCRPGSPGAREDDDISAVQFSVRTSLLNHNPNATCSGLDIGDFKITLDGSDEGIPEPTCKSSLGNPISFSRDLAGGDYVVEVVARDASDQPLTATKAQVVTVGELPGELFALDFDFADTDFLEPIVDSTEFTLSFLQSDSDDAPVRVCDPPSGFGQLIVDQVKIRFTNAHGTELLDRVQTIDGTALDFSLMPCPPAPIETELLSWGGFGIEVEALSPAGEVCFATDTPVPAAPGTSFPLAVPRVIDPLPPSCADCQTDSDCPGNPCIDGICRP